MILQPDLDKERDWSAFMYGKTTSDGDPTPGTPPLLPIILPFNQVIYWEFAAVIEIFPEMQSVIIRRGTLIALELYLITAVFC